MNQKLTGRRVTCARHDPALGVLVCCARMLFAVLKVMLYAFSHYFFPFQFTRFADVLRFDADLADLLLHCAIVGRQAGYDPPDLRLLRPQGPPVLQLTQPLPLLRPNHFRRPSLLLLFFAFATFIAPVFCADLAAFHQSSRAIG